MRLTVHRFGGVGFCVGRKELGHVHGNGLLDVFVGRAWQRELISSGRALPHHVLADSGWISFWIRYENDAPNALALLQLALEGTAARSAAALTPATSPADGGRCG